MRGVTRRSALILSALLFTLVVLATSTRSDAARPEAASHASASQLPPLTVPPLPPLPSQLQPTLELISPIAAPACANAVLVGVLVPALGVPIPPELQTALGPLFVVCGSIPQPTGDGRTCSLDSSLKDLLSGAGLPIPLTLAPTQLLYTQVLQIEKSQATIAPAFPIIPLSSNIAGVLQCTDAPVPVSTTIPTPPASPAPTEPAPEHEMATTTPITGSAPSTNAPPAAERAAATPATELGAPIETVSLVKQPLFAYPAAMLVPLLLLLAGGYLRHILIHPVAPARARNR